MLALDSGIGKIERSEIGSPTRRMHHEVRAESFLALRARMDDELVAPLLHRVDARAQPDVDPEFAEFFHQPIDQVGIEPRQHAVGALQDRDRGAGAGCYMRELGRDVSAADEHDPARQTIEVQEFGAVGDPGCTPPQRGSCELVENQIQGPAPACVFFA